MQSQNVESSKRKFKFATGQKELFVTNNVRIEKVAAIGEQFE
jgi:hypothetical protein